MNKYTKFKKQSCSTKDSRRGSALLAAVGFTVIVAILMGSYLRLASSEYRISSRSFMMNGAFNLAEGGVELAMDALNRSDSSGWTSGSADGDPYYARLYSGYELGGGLEGEIRVVVLNPGSQTPTIYSQGRIVGSTVSTSLNRQITVTTDSGFFPWKNGVDSKSGFELSGNNITVDSYNSNTGDYGGSNVGSEATVSTVAVTVDAANVGNADIYGYVATGGSSPDVGPQGSITTYDNPGNGVIDGSRITTDYYAEFPDVEAYDFISSSPSTTFPTSGEIGDYDDAVIDIKQVREYYLTSSWSASGDIDIYDDVIIVTTADMSLTGTHSINLRGPGTLTIFTSGNISFKGKGVANGDDPEPHDDGALPTDGKPQNFMIFGMQSSSTPGVKTIEVGGNGQLSAAVYAPNANVKINGNGMVLGSIVGYEVKFTGNAHFSYDEALSDYNIGDGLYGVDDWVEMTSIDLNTTPVDMSIYGL